MSVTSAGVTNSCCNWLWVALRISSRSLLLHAIKRVNDRTNLHYPWDVNSHVGLTDWRYDAESRYLPLYEYDCTPNILTDCTYWDACDLRRQFSYVLPRLFDSSRTISSPKTFRTRLNKSATVDINFVPVLPPGELDVTYASSLILAHWLHYVKTWRHP